MANEVPYETGEFLAQRNLLLIACISALLILAPDFKGLDLNLAIVHLKVDNALYVRGFIFLSLCYLTVRYSQAAKSDDRYAQLKNDLEKLYASCLAFFSISIHYFYARDNTYDLKSSINHLIWINRYPKDEGRKSLIDFRKVDKSANRREVVEADLIEKFIISVKAIIAYVVTIIVSPLAVVNVLEFIFPYFLTLFAMLEMANVHLFSGIVSWAGGLFPDPSPAASQPQTETCLGASGALDLLEAYRHALLGFEYAPEYIALEGK